MGRSKAEKLFDYVSQRDVLKVKSFLKKHHHDYRLDVNATLPGRVHRQRTPLHVACACGDDAMLRVLMKYGARADVPDSHGDTPLHLALQRALHGHKHAFKDLVLPILEKSCPSIILDIANKRGRTPRQLLKEFEQVEQERVQRLRREYEEKAADEARQREEAEWQSRLQDEWAADMAGMSDHALWHDTGYTGLNQESFDDWATRIAAEQRQKQQQRYQGHQPSRSSHSREDAQDRERRQEEKRNFQRKLEEEHARYQRRHSERLRQKLLRQKAEHLQRCAEVFSAESQELSQLGLEDVPWPGHHGNPDKMIQVLTCDINREDAAELRRFVRSQQLLWHPDKFLQKCGSRLVERDRDKIMERVTQLSQALNQLGEEEKSD
ncbi:NF-kappa-B inhibitor-like protein 1 [Patiria miniata]|uniref:NF-kappa-B inhibitor-like protein 1 n=1 Tax=Patiria miniata TaxID=46514 RepID=A0A914AJT7_PATMI|nr:NF-kappa-B inhibitor-like protein 1 [Patiria miniata]XP_038064251.1 NF-kappa-B inhibitor-like protein 1 [Patiria miniata]